MIIYRLVKGSRLTNAEVDGNFKTLADKDDAIDLELADLDSRVTEVENKTVGPASATVLGAVKIGSGINVTTDGTISATPASIGAISALALGVANGVASLDGSGLVPASQLPSYVDDILEFPNLAAFPTPGEPGKIYVAINGGDSPSNPSKLYRWSGSAYVLIPASPGSTDEVAEGTTNLYFTQARVRATTLLGLNTALTGTITAADSVLTALGRLQNQVGNGGGGSVKASKTFTATAAQTTFNIPGGFTPGLSSVTIDGADIYSFQDTNAADIVMIDGYAPKAGQTVRVTYYKGFTVADALPAGGQAVDAARLGGILPSGYLKATDFQQFMTITSRTATAAGQTVFAASRPVAGPIIVSLNGGITRDFTTSAGSANVTLATGVPNVGDEVDIYEFQGFAVANALAANGTAVDSSRLNGQLAAFYAGVSDLNALAAVVAGIPFTKYYETTITGWVASGQLTITHNLGVIPKLVAFQVVAKTAIGQLTANIPEDIINGWAAYGASTQYGIVSRNPTTTTLQATIGNGGMTASTSAGSMTAVSNTQVDIKVKVFA